MKSGLSRADVVHKWILRNGTHATHPFLPPFYNPVTSATFHTFSSTSTTTTKTFCQTGQALERLSLISPLKGRLELGVPRLSRQFDPGQRPNLLSSNLAWGEKFHPPSTILAGGSSTPQPTKALSATWLWYLQQWILIFHKTSANYVSRILIGNTSRRYNN